MSRNTSGDTLPECFVLTSVNEPEVTEEPWRVAGPAVAVELQHKSGARTVEHMGYVRIAPAQQPRPRGVFIHFRSFQMEEQFQEVAALTAETQSST
jgi:hypothetical protein